MNEIEKKGKESFALHKRILELKNQGMSMYLELGACLSIVKKNKVWEDLGYESFWAYIAVPELGFSKQAVCQMVNIYEKFCVELELSPGRVGEIYWTKLREIIPVVTKENCLEWLNEAKESSRSDLITKVQETKDKKDHEHEWEDEVWERCTVCGKKRKKGEE